MCNSYEARFNVSELKLTFGELGLAVVGAPARAAEGGRRPTDPAPIVRTVAGGVEIVELRWGLVTPGVKGPVTNRRADGRRFDAGRCLVPAEAFHEWTGPASPGTKKTKWRFTVVGATWFCFAGIWRTAPTGEARFAILTIAPGPDVLPYHDRQPAILDRRDWQCWLAPEPVPADWLGPLPPGSLAVENVSAPAAGQLRLL